jgi:hypothetical protein
MNQVFEVHFEEPLGGGVNALKGLAVWAEMVQFMRERDNGLERVAAYNSNSDKLDWDTSRWGTGGAEPAIVVFQERDEFDAFSLCFAEHIRSTKPANRERWIDDDPSPEAQGE